MDLSKLRRKALRVHRTLSSILSIKILILLSISCTTLPITDHPDYEFPEEKAFIEAPTKKYEKLGPVRSKVNFSLLDPEFDVLKLCKNYYNRAVKELVKYAERAGGDAVIEVKSVVFYRDGKMEVFKTPECSEDEEEGQVLTRGIAVKWVKEKKPKVD